MREPLRKAPESYWMLIGTTYPLGSCNYAQQRLSYAHAFHKIHRKVVDKWVVFWALVLLHLFLLRVIGLLAV